VALNKEFIIGGFMKRFFFLLTAFLLLSLVYHADAQIPRTLSYQGVLTNNSGQPEPDKDYAFKFCLYESGAGGSPIWCEEKILPVKNGLFSTILGDKTPFGPAVKFDRPYWLGIQVGNEPELSPHIPLTSVGYSMSSLRADTARVAMASSADTTWKQNGSSIYRNTGNVGIGMIPPHSAKLAIRGSELVGQPFVAGSILLLETSGAEGALVFGKLNAEGASFIQSARAGAASEIVLNPEGGNVGIGVVPPHATKLAVQAVGLVGMPFVSGSILDLKTLGAHGALSFGKLNEVGASFIQSSGNGAANEIVLNPEGGNIGIGTLNPTAKLDVAGHTKTKVLEITGGADLAEPFEMSHTEPLPAGALVVIDKDNPGKLKLATEPYDKRVAGVTSGAGGVNPGLTLQQEGVLAGGQHVALTGKVYALATAANGAIEPGDLLTTSHIPGHAMKTTEQARWLGAVIGKAMSGLELGEGLVLVLVNLQ
jgi:hypothetical protein